ncbi:Alkylsulfatase [Rhodococcus sp. YH1]|nr:Alkylsulfatase [Rhodococcus sp. YH1]
MSTAFDATVATLTLDKLGPRFGAEISGLDVASATDAEISAVRAALTQHKVLVLRGQSLDDASHIEFGRRLGQLTAGHPVHDSGNMAQEVYALDSQDNGFADVWHTDVTFMKRPPLGSILRPLGRVSKARCLITTG